MFLKHDIVYKAMQMTKFVQMKINSSAKLKNMKRINLKSTLYFHQDGKMLKDTKVA